jgi:RsiW-degrading membrane proteinase PrsW (M82 family)
MGYVLLALIAFCPAIFYMLYIIAFDHRKPEPPRALVISALLGIVVAMPVVLSLEASVVRIEEGLSFTQSFILVFFKLALPSEVAKWLVLCVFLSLNRFYDEYIDGIVYSVCLAMGYVGIFGAWFLSGYLDESFATLLEMSAIMIFVLVPIHFISGTIMGYYLGLARKHRKILNHVLALFLSIFINGMLGSMVLMIGNHWEYYFVVGAIFTILAMVVYTQIFHMQELDQRTKKME